MDSIDYIKIYLASVDNTIQAINSLRTIHKVYLNNKMGDILESSIVSYLAYLEEQLLNYAQEEKEYA